MKNGGWAPGVYENFMETYDYVTCIRGDGSYYGNGGTKCNKGTKATKKDLVAEKKKAAAGDKEAAKKVAKMEKYGVGGSDSKGKEEPIAKEKVDETKIKAAYKKKMEQAQEAMQKGDMEKALKLNAEATAISKRLPTKAIDTQNPRAEIADRMKDMKKRSAKRPEKREISDEAKKALLTYAREEPKPPAYKTMNGCARGKRCTKAAQKDIENLDKALKEWPTNEAGASHFRGFNVSGTQRAQYAGLKPGDKISDGGFGSYSRNPEIASNFSQGKGTRVIIESRSKSLHGIERNARFKSEQEAILPRNTSQTVREVKQVGEFLFVVVD